SSPLWKKPEAKRTLSGDVTDMEQRIADRAIQMKTRVRSPSAGSDRTGLLLVPPALLFLLFLIVPLIVLFTIAFNPSERGLIALQSSFSVENFARFFSAP